MMTKSSNLMETQQNHTKILWLALKAPKMWQKSRPDVALWFLWKKSWSRLNLLTRSNQLSSIRMTIKELLCKSHHHIRRKVAVKNAMMVLRQLRIRNTLEAGSLAQIYLQIYKGEAMKLSTSFYWTKWFKRLTKLSIFRKTSSMISS